MAPMPLLIVTLVALDAVTLSVTLCPGLTVVEEAVNVTVGSGSGGTNASCGPRHPNVNTNDNSVAENPARRKAKVPNRIFKGPRGENVYPAA
jgi:hypothetical protein